jgi:hypothetical protein
MSSAWSEAARVQDAMTSAAATAATAPILVRVMLRGGTIAGGSPESPGGRGCEVIVRLPSAE